MTPTHLLTYRVDAYTGWDLRLCLYPPARQAREVARRLLASAWVGLTQQALDETPYIVELPSGRAFRLRDLHGAVEPRTPVHLPVVGT